MCKPDVVAEAAKLGLQLETLVDAPGACHWWGLNTWCPVSMWWDCDGTYRVGRYARANRLKCWRRVYKGKVLATALRHAANFVKETRQRPPRTEL